MRGDRAVCSSDVARTTQKVCEGACGPRASQSLSVDSSHPPARNDGAVIPKERAKDQRIHEGCVRLRNLREGIALSVRAM